MSPAAVDGEEPQEVLPENLEAAKGEPSTIRSVLRRPHIAQMLLSSVLARMPFGAATLLIVLHLTGGGHSYGEAGIAAGAYSLGLAFCAPVLARLIDRSGQTKVLFATALGGAAATATLGLTPGDAPLPLLVVIAGIAGAAQPPLGGVMRALWDVLLVDHDDRHIGYSLEATAVESVFTIGPLLFVGTIAALAGTTAALVSAAAFTAAGTLVIASSRPSRSWTPHDERHDHPLGPLRSSGVRSLMIVGIGTGMGFSAVEIGVTAFAKQDASTAFVGVMLAIWSIGSLIGGLASARLTPPRNPAGRIATLLGTMAVLNAVLGVAPTLWVLGPLLLLASGLIAPTFAASNGAIGRVAPEGTITEALSWTTGAVMVGSTLGSPAAGFLVDHVSISAALAFSGAGPALAALLVLARQHSLRPRR